MTIELQSKRDFAQVAARHEAWLLGRNFDRPLISATMRRKGEFSWPGKSHSSVRQRWLDAEFQVDCAAARMAATEYLFDAFPRLDPNMGPVITAALYGCELEFDDDTSWAAPIVQEVSQWQRVIDTEPDFDNLHWRAVESMMDYALDRYRGQFLTGMTDLHGNYDILAALRDPQLLCMDLMDEPELVDRAARHVAQGFVQSFDRSYAKLAKASQGSTCWLSFYHAGPAYVPSSDFWCMVSPQMARQYVLPCLEIEVAPLERSVFHLDGINALPHLPLLLEMPSIHAIQWVYGAGHGPAANWIQTYKKILAAGKSVQVLATDADDALAVLEACGPRGVWLTLDRHFATPAAVAEFDEKVQRICKRFAKQKS